MQSIFSFLYPASFPPKTQNEFKAACKSQSEGFKCLKEKTKGTLPLLRRGVLTMVSTRQRHHRRYCTNLESEHSKRFLQGTKCFMEKRFKSFNEADSDLVRTLAAIMRNNYKDASLELKQICCSFFNYRKRFHEAVGEECASHKGMADDLLQSIMVEDVSLVCEDEEKLSKVCPKLEKVDLEPLRRDPTFKVGPGGQSGSTMALYLFATLGEPNEDLINFA